MMRSVAAILYHSGHVRPDQDARPLEVNSIAVADPSEGEVLVEVRAAGLCHSDLSVIDGTRPRPLPMVLGHEAAGIVRAVGRGVVRFHPGDPVLFSFVPMCGHCTYCQTGRPALCEPGNRANAQGTLLSGARRFRDHQGRELHHHLGVSAFTQFTVTAQESLIPLPPDIPLEKAALFGCALLTGIGAVINTASVRPGSQVAVFGIGGVGLAAVMGAALAGASRIVVVDIRPHKFALARDLGATDCVDAQHADPVEAVRELTKGGADYAFEAAGNPDVLLQAYQATKRGGMTVAVGLPHGDRRMSLPHAALVAEEKMLRGSYMGSSVPQRDVPRFLTLYQTGKLPVDRLISREIGLADINDGFQALASGEVVRQIVRF